MNSDERRQKIIVAAIEVLLEKGVAASRMNDFVSASGLSKGGVYHHFDSKENLLIGVLEHLMGNVLDPVNMQIDTTQSAYLQLQGMIISREEIMIEMSAYNQIFLDFFVQARSLPIFREKINSQYIVAHTHIAKLIQLGIKQGEFKAATDADAIAAGLRGVFDGIGIALSIAPEKINFPHSAIQSALALIRGITK
ncbi:TetR/AcrR family transcriptional regulator [Zhongshania aquimaris]|uniref:TetR/AcrR family transcriptional regulator n=1 Tax=Zhongshania aquimaris TaxID=2857107 RepID=A0ABS6VWF0_9GAMM|nr:TetR/AcrR family transcriptional regulator [Zhongshania aquimaris]MBW2942692.1 TetR/AcrR family transcriptional regulator [Zhongshania aquimaris]